EIYGYLGTPAAHGGISALHGGAYFAGGLLNSEACYGNTTDIFYRNGSFGRYPGLIACFIVARNIDKQLIIRADNIVFWGGHAHIRLEAQRPRAEKIGAKYAGAWLFRVRTGCAAAGIFVHRTAGIGLTTFYSDLFISLFIVLKPDLFHSFFEFFNFYGIHAPRGSRLLQLGVG